MNLKALLDRWTQMDGFTDKSLARRQLEELIGFILDISWSDIQLNPDRIVSEQALESFESKAQRLLAGEPLNYITGEKFFYKKTFKVSPAVLIPRPETEMLVEAGLKHLKNDKGLVMDLGAGSGCVGLSLALEKPQSKIVLIENSPLAIPLMEANAKALAVANIEILEAQVGDSSICPPPFEADLIVANPPYIDPGDPRVEASTHRFEPHSALYCDDDGLACIKSWVNWSYPRLRQGCRMIFEFGKGQETAIADFIATTDYSTIEVIADYSQINRFYVIEK